MERVRSLTLLLVISMLAHPAWAQQQASAPLPDNLVPASLETNTPIPSERLLPAPAGDPFVRAVSPGKLPEHKFFDRQQLLALYVHSGVRLADTIKTCRSIAHGGVEDWIPTQSCAGIAAWQAGSVGLALGVGWLFHKHGHHTLERITPWAGTGASAAGLAKSVFNIH